ncbi:MAG: DUF2975 domain-containing protein [Ruminococcus sp.]|nr:DUF2975 domain-containing protein [Ruminococcus sp.]
MKKKNYTKEELIKEYMPTLKVLAVLMFVLAAILVLLLTTDIQLISSLAADKATLSKDAKDMFFEVAASIFSNTGYLFTILTSAALFISTIKEGTPFTKKTSTILFIIALELIITGVFAPIGARYLTTSVINERYAVKLASNDIFAGSLLSIISSFFRYGTKLQQESDETL